MKLRLTAALIVLAILVVVLAFPSWIAPRDVFKLDVRHRLQPPSADHWFGTDEGGRDLFTRVIHGARFSVGMAIAIVVSSATFGSICGVVAGYVGGNVGTVMMRIVDLFLAFPYLVLAMAIASAMGRGVASAIVALAVVWWPSYARMVRGQVLSIKEHLHVEAARALGASEMRILFRHILPLTANELNARITLDVGYAILALTGLGFLGLGAQNPSPEWGLMVSNSQVYVMRAWWYGVFPGVAILATVLAFTYLGDYLMSLLSRRGRAQG